MNKIYTDKYYTKNFIDKDLRKIIKKLLLCEVINNSYEKVYDDFLNKNYKTNLRDVCNKVADTLLISGDSKNYIIYLNNNIYINKNKLETIANIIDYGSGSIRGCKLFSKVFDYVNNNIACLYEISKIG